MIEIVPVMLFILGWHPDKPGKIDLQRPEIVFTDMAECETAGKTIADRMTKAAADNSGTRYQFRCVTFPDRLEFDKAYRDMQDKTQ
ncbi:hypothetical protein QWY75_03305 [Pontixanthobacter aestiaquae]|uniref:Uncharacterized protein n=1 Tax=Pontixanthobacter aestiaquae TaxID=1509367 RepID=A0A844Z996_9SPHN|nr:hypothetical protein [Pontixanthobacter aestiaquae]MDN3645232.1 hypothetical protein [Pontixanthobacter aestiaquae]MXO83766.1 hypothetical protein [Pontixanthobacter aestiaquae]